MNFGLVRTSHLCEELTEVWERGGFARVVCATNGRAPNLSENSLKTSRQPRTLCRDTTEGRALWEKLRIGEPLKRGPTEQWAPLQVGWGQSSLSP